MALVTRVVTKTSIDLLVVKVERAKMDNGMLNHRLLLTSLKFKVMERGYGIPSRARPPRGGGANLPQKLNPAFELF